MKNLFCPFRDFEVERRVSLEPSPPAGQEVGKSPEAQKEEETSPVETKAQSAVENAEVCLKKMEGGKPLNMLIDESAATLGDSLNFITFYAQGRADNQDVQNIALQAEQRLKSLPEQSSEESRGQILRDFVLQADAFEREANKSSAVSQAPPGSTEAATVTPPTTAQPEAASAVPPAVTEATPSTAPPAETEGAAGKAGEPDKAAPGPESAGERAGPHEPQEKPTAPKDAIKDAWAKDFSKNQKSDAALAANSEWTVSDKVRTRLRIRNEKGAVTGHVDASSAEKLTLIDNKVYTVNDIEFVRVRHGSETGYVAKEFIKLAKKPAAPAAPTTATVAAAEAPATPAKAPEEKVNPRVEQFNFNEIRGLRVGNVYLTKARATVAKAGVGTVDAGQIIRLAIGPAGQPIIKDVQGSDLKDISVWYAGKIIDIPLLTVQGETNITETEALQYARDINDKELIAALTRSSVNPEQLPAAAPAVSATPVPRTPVAPVFPPATGPGRPPPA